MTAVYTRITRGGLNQLAIGGLLIVGMQYYLTDDDVVAYAVSTRSYTVSVRSGKVVTVGTIPPSSPRDGDLWVDLS